MSAEGRINTEHTPEPWVVEVLGSTTRITEVCGEEFGTDLFIVGDCHKPENQANARRIVACVNACAGIPTELLERRGPNVWAEAIMALEREDELAATRRQTGAKGAS